MQNSEYTACVNPTGMFPEFDSAWVNLFESREIDMPCETYGFLLNVTGLAAIVLVAFAYVAAHCAFESWLDRRKYRRTMARYMRH